MRKHPETRSEGVIAILAEMEKTRVRLVEKSMAEGRRSPSFVFLEGLMDTVVGDLLVETHLAGKDIIQAMLLFSTAISYLSNERPFEWKKETVVGFTTENYDELKKLMAENNLSKNMGQRALPILLMLAEANATGPFNAIELGASTGLIGRALVDAQRFVDQIDRYCDISEAFAEYAEGVFDENGIPEIDSYIGIDQKIPDLNWNYHCIENEAQRAQFEEFINYFPDSSTNQQLIERSALGFSTMGEVDGRPLPLVITSMMLYQLPPEIRSQLSAEIASFLSITHGYWVQMDYDEKENRFTGFFTQFTEPPVQSETVIFSKGESVEYELKDKDHLGS